MGKLRVLSGKEVCQILSKHGFQNIRQRGSHIIMQKKTDTSTITVPVPNHKQIKLGTVAAFDQGVRTLMVHAFTGSDETAAHFT